MQKGNSLLDQKHDHSIVQVSVDVRAGIIYDINEADIFRHVVIWGDKLLHWALEQQFNFGQIFFECQHTLDASIADINGAGLMIELKELLYCGRELPGHETTSIG